MNRNCTIINILISCPSDIVEEVKIVKDAISRLNARLIQDYNICINTQHWESHSYSKSGNAAQTILNQQLVDNADALIAMFWTKYGTATETHGSGTEEEINRIIAEGKQVFLYFLEYSPPKITEINPDQLKKIEIFKQHYSENKKGLYKRITKKEDLSLEITNNIHAYISEIYKKSHNERINKELELKIPQTILFMTLPEMAVTIEVNTNRGLTKFSLFHNECYSEVIYGEDLFNITEDNGQIILNTDATDITGYIRISS